jgi:hypothetical protein
VNTDERESLLALWRDVPELNPDGFTLTGGDDVPQSFIPALARDALVEWLLSKCKLGILVQPPYRPDAPHTIYQRVPAGVMGPSYDKIGEGLTRLLALIAAVRAVHGAAQ